MRLLGSFTMESSLSLMPRTETTVEVEAGPAEDASAGLPFEAGGVPEPAQSVRPALRPAQIGAAVWPAGMAAMGLWTLAGWLRLRRRVAEAVPEEDGVWLCEGVDAPFLLGLWRPRI